MLRAGSGSGRRVPTGAGGASGTGDVHVKREQLPIVVILSGVFIRVLGREPVIGSKRFDAASIGREVATRAIMADLRAGMDGVGGGPPPFSNAGRSNFLQALDRVLVEMGRVSVER